MQRRPYRTILFVPATRPEWLQRAVDSPADALIVDLEDAVPEAEKESARRTAGTHVRELVAAGREGFVRINPVTSEHWPADLEAVVHTGLVGVAVPKVYRPGEVLAVAEALSALEAERGTEAGATDVQPLLETRGGGRFPPSRRRSRRWRPSAAWRPARPPSGRCWRRRSGCTTPSRSLAPPSGCAPASPAPPGTATPTASWASAGAAAARRPSPCARTCCWRGAPPGSPSRSAAPGWTSSPPPASRTSPSSRRRSATRACT